MYVRKYYGQTIPETSVENNTCPSVSWKLKR